jgi:hypothetical protein
MVFKTIPVRQPSALVAGHRSRLYYTLIPASGATATGTEAGIASLDHKIRQLGVTETFGKQLCVF